MATGILILEEVKMKAVINRLGLNAVCVKLFLAIIIN